MYMNEVTDLLVEAIIKITQIMYVRGDRPFVFIKEDIFRSSDITP
jgi:hypothetical protein